MRRWLPLVLLAPLLAPVSSGAAATDAPGTWLTGDTHVHTDHSSDGSLLRQVVDQGAPGTTSVSTQIAAALRRQLQFLPLTDHRTYSQQWDPQWTSSGLVLIPGEEANGSPHANVLGATDDLVDGGHPAGSAEFRHVQQSIWDVHAQDGVWQTNHPDDGEMEDDGRPNANASALGVDTVEVFNSGSPERKIDYAENRWNAGFRFGSTGASDNHFSEADAVQGPGLPATRVLSQGDSERDVLDALRAGRTAVTRGTPDSAVLRLDADLDRNGSFETVGGDERRASGKVTLRVRVDNGIGATVLLYHSPGRSAGPIATLLVTQAHAELQLTVTVPHGLSWFRAEARRHVGTSGISDIPAGLDYRPPDPRDQLQAATSPVFLYTDHPAVPRPALALPPTTGSDAARLAIGSRGSFTGFPDVAVSGSSVHVVAETHSPGRTAVVYQRADGSLVDLAPRSRAARFPRVAAKGSSVWVVWQDERSGQRPRRADVYLRHSADGGRTWQPEIRLTRGAGRAEHPVVALTDATHPVVAWMDNRGGAFDVLVQQVGVDVAPIDVAAPGKVTSAGNLVDARSPRYPASLFPSLAVSPRGVVAVVWQDDRFDVDPLWTGHAKQLDGAEVDGTAPDDDEVLVSTRAAGRWSAPANASRSPKASDRHPSAVYDRHGVLHVAWDTRELKASGANLSLRTASSRDGRAFSRPAPLALAAEAMSQRPRLSLDPGGAVRAVWYDSRSADWRWKVMTAVLGRSGVRTLTGAGNATWAAVAGGQVVFTTDRNARVQRDVTQQVYRLRL